MWQPVLGWRPFRRLYLGNTWWYRICRCAFHLLRQCSSCYLVCTPTTSQVKQNRFSCSSNRCIVGQLSTVLFVRHVLWTWYGNIGWKPLKKNFKELYTQLTGFTWISHFLLSFLPIMIQIGWKHGWFENNTFLWMVTGWKPSLQSVHSSPMCRVLHLVETNCYK